MTQTLVCLASYFKGLPFLHASRELGWRVVVVTKERARNEPWPAEDIDELIVVADHAAGLETIDALRPATRETGIDRVVALEEFDVVTAGEVREHFGIPGMGTSAARRFRDKLVMRNLAGRHRIRMPDFTAVDRPAAVAAFLERVPAPWILKPRGGVSSFGIRRLDRAEDVWAALTELDARPALDERATHYLLEEYVAGDVYHVDALVSRGQVVFTSVQRYGRPPMDVMHQGGVFISRTVPYGGDERLELERLTRQIVPALGLVRGAAHVEFIRARQGGFAFLEIGARVGGAHVSDLVEAATGLNLWREWARLELGDEMYALPEVRTDHAGLVLSLARQDTPDTSAYVDPEIAFRVTRKHHAGLIVRSSDAERVAELIAEYTRRFEEDFCATLAPPERAR